MSDFLQPLWNSPGQNTGVGRLFLLQGFFPTQGLNPGLPHCRWILNQLNHKGSPRILECIAYPSSSSSSWPRNRTRVSCLTGRLFTSWALREAHSILSNVLYIFLSCVKHKWIFFSAERIITYWKIEGENLHISTVYTTHVSVPHGLHSCNYSLQMIACPFNSTW